MPKYIKLNKEEQECAEFLGLDSNKIDEKQYQEIKETLKTQKDNLDQATTSSSGTTEKKVEKKKINKNKIIMEKKVRFLQNRLNTLSKTNKQTNNITSSHIDLENYLNSNSPTFCNFCNECDMCNYINDTYDEISSHIAKYGVIKK